MSNELEIVAVGEVESSLSNYLCPVVLDRFGRQCATGQSLPEPSDAFDQYRRQYSAETILRRLEPTDAERVLGRWITTCMFQRSISFLVWRIGNGGGQLLPYHGWMSHSLTDQRSRRCFVSES
jgi:hypothetical protein